MLDFIYTLLIAPLEYWMHAALVWGYGHTNNWGWAIVVMSLAVNTVILPIYIKAEKWQEDERALRKSFENKEAMIKRSFKGQERFAMMTTMHRQAGYSPLLSLRSSIGFFLQIPFFFAAYHFLSHFEPLAGISFMGLADLSKPDAAISLGSFSINVMPILMTVINLASALIYTHNLTRRDKMQLYAMAAVFLVLLYDAASGLVLYWTCNNIYSLGKNIVYQELGRIKPFAAKVRSAFYAWQHGRAPEVFSRSLLYAVPLVLWAAGALLALISSNQISLISEALKNSISLGSDFAFVASIVAALALAVKLKLWRHHWLMLLLSVVIAYYGLRVWGKWFFFGENRRGFAVTGGFLFLIPALGILHAGIDLRRFLFPQTHSSRSSKPSGTLLVPAGIWLTLLLAAYLPVQAYCTAPEIFSSADVILAKSLMWSALLGAFFWFFGFAAQSCGAKNFAGYLLSAIASVFTVYAFILPLDVGTIDAFQIAKPAPLFRDVNLLIDIVVILGTLTLFALIIKKGGAKWIKTTFIVLILGSIANGTLLLWQTRGQWKTEETAGTTKAELPEYTERLFGFSKKGQNILVVMLDAFTGTHYREILTAAPELKNELDGFVWHTDMVSAGGSTASSVASLICGEACTPSKLNAAGPEPLAEKINKRYAEVAERLGKDWDISLYERNWLEEMRLKKYTEQDVLAIRHLSEAFVDHYIGEQGIEIGRGNSDSFLLAVSIFSSVPWSGKNLIYKNGRWLEQLMGDHETTLVMRALRDWALFELLPDISNTKAQKNTFKFIDTELTHHPWFMDLGKCSIKQKPKREISPDGIPLSHLATEICSLKSLAKWFAWMKKEGIWNNTTVVLASDHSAGDDPSFNKLFDNSAVPAPRRANALMLVKKAGASGKLKIDDKPTSAAAVSSLWTGASPTTTVREHVLAMPKGSQYLIEKQWFADGAMTNVKSWRISN